MVKILFFLLFVSISFASDISALILIESKLYPKVAEINLNKKPTIAIVYDDKTYKLALKLKKMIKNAKLIKKVKNSFDAYIFVKKITQKELNTLIKNKKLIFSIYPDEIKNSMFSVYIGVKVRPYINPKLIKKANLKINPILFKVGKIYEK